MATFPIVMTSSGYLPQTPNALQQALIANVAATNPGYTANLPGSLIEDISSTDVYALLQCDSSVAEIINSLTPYGANEFLLNQLGSIYGIQLGQETNTSCYVQVSGPYPGLVIPQGFTVSDGTYQYIIPDGGVVGAAGVSLPLYAVATVPGSWAVTPGSVNQFVTSVLSLYPLLTVSNPLAGVPATGVETAQSYRSRVLQAGLAASQGMARYLRTLLQNLPGVQSRLVSVLQLSDQGWEIICGGGDPYQVAYAIYMALFDINATQGSVLLVDGITQANPAVVTTTLNTEFATGQVVGFTGIVGMTNLNNVIYQTLYATVLSQTTFSLSASAAITSMVLAAGAVTVTTTHNLLGLINGHTYTAAISGVTPSGYNGSFTITITGANTFTYPLSGSPGSVTIQGSVLAPVDSTGWTAYSSGGVVTPNLKNVTVSLLDYPDTYSLTFVNPPQQTVAIAVTWNTNATNYVSQSAVAQQGNIALVNYVNSIVAGQPMNLFEMQTVFQASVANIVPPQLLTRMVFAVSINGVGVSPEGGTGIIAGDPESYFETNTVLVTINQG